MKSPLLASGTHRIELNGMNLSKTLSGYDVIEFKAVILQSDTLPLNAKVCVPYIFSYRQVEDEEGVSMLIPTLVSQYALANMRSLMKSSQINTDDLSEESIQQIGERLHRGEPHVVDVEVKEVKPKIFRYVWCPRNN